MKKLLLTVCSLLIATNLWAASAHENVAIVDGTAVVSSTNPLHVTGVAGAGFTAGAILDALVPSAAGKILWADSGSHCGAAHTSACSDSNDCLTPATACLTIMGAMNKTGSVTGDVVMASGSFAENVVISNYGVSLIGYNGYGGVGITSDLAFIQPASGTPLTLSGGGALVAGFFMTPTPAFTNSVRDTSGGNILMSNNISGDTLNDAATILLIGVTTDTLKNNTINNGKYGIELRGAVGNTYQGVRIENNQFVANQLADIVAASSATMGAGLQINGNSFDDLDKSSYIDVSGATSGTATASNNWFNVTTPAVLRTQLGGLSKLNVLGNWPPGEGGSNTDVQPKTETSSNITTGGVTEFTAQGNQYCTDILLETGSTGLATGTNFTLTSNSTNGPAVICAVAVASLGANAAVPCSKSTNATPLVPFTLPDGKTLVAKCTGSSCTAAGTIKITPLCMRQAAYASMYAGVAPTPTATATATASPSPSATPTQTPTSTPTP